MMWVGEQRPIVHNAGGHGVLRELPEGAFRKAKTATKFSVYRPDQIGVGARAAEYAIGWSVEGSYDDHPTVKSPYDLAKKTYDQGYKKFPLKEKATGRYELAGVLQDKVAGGSDWTVESLYRVVKAVARRYDAQGLSPNHGVTCSQFVVYCYQAAWLEMKFGDIINKGVLGHLTKDRASAKFLRLQDLEAKNPLKAALAEIDGRALPVGLRVEPKSVLVDSLTTLLQKGDSGFNRAGYLVHQNGRLLMWRPTDGEDPEDVSLADVIKHF